MTLRHARRRRVLLGALAAAPFAAASRARVEPAFPSRPVRIVAPHSVGIGPDVVARTVDRIAGRAT